MNVILAAKAVHVIGFVSWFAGLFFLGRLLVNHAETDARPPAEAALLAAEYAGMEQRVYRIITVPALVITLSAGFTMVGFNPGYFVSGSPGWLWTKLAAVAGLVGYQWYTKNRLLDPMQRGARPFSPWQLRLWNEVPTFFLAGIVFTAVFGKVGQLNYWYLATGLLVFSWLVVRGAVAYREKRAAG